ncbi:probable bifunctional dTTP/UTP pyrophosphatase/methyltransferase protein isoform X1 [Dromiciops gliroides]|uniref:probable bifunctional dTTP/UTP pyrophosphatase/methyltransferase protein isoform X1 n=1 Tax=Dromiciops gliroides TaxID=33562 RepID=UPI001CC7C913|nr:probable bifunctional dTTP/UTP pyrophosphatase/methyltransferase protein isoform X1 [Dromiciops gliroides]
MVLCPVIQKLVSKRVVLASASPRRQEILNCAGLRFEVVPSRFKETLDKASFAMPYEYAMETAKQKALEVANRMNVKDFRSPDVVIGADTIVTVDGLILEKPVDKRDAYNMLSRLNGKVHSVFTGVAIVHCNSKDKQLETEVFEFYEETKVKFSDLSEELLWEYIHSGEPMDKAGGYGIQALGGMLVEYVHGDFLNVVGFPLNHFCKKLMELYYPPPKDAIHHVKHDSIPSVETFEVLSDEECGSSNSTQQNATRTSKLGDGATGSLGKKEIGQHMLREPMVKCSGDLENLTKFPSTLLELLDGFKASKAMFVACKLKVFDLLKGKAILKAKDVADHINASVCGTERLLDSCTALELLKKTNQGYSNTELADKYLVSDSEYSLHGYIMHANDHVWPLFTHLESAVKEGKNQNHRAFGKKAQDLFQDSYYHSMETKLRFMNAMHSIIKLTARDVATAFDLSRFRSACDLGGCTGALAQVLIQEYPNLKVTVFDLPNVIENVACFQPTGQDTSRITFTSGDFFKDNIPEADLYILSRVLHDWPDDKIDALLSRISDVCTPGCALLVAEIVLGEEKIDPPRAVLQSLSMTEGKQRSSSEYKQLLEKYGFTQVQTKITGNFLDAILGFKKTTHIVN